MGQTKIWPSPIIWHLYRPKQFFPLWSLLVDLIWGYNSGRLGQAGSGINLVQSCASSLLASPSLSLSLDQLKFESWAQGWNQNLSESPTRAEIFFRWNNSVCDIKCISNSATYAPSECPMPKHKPIPNSAQASKSGLEAEIKPNHIFMWAKDMRARNLPNAKLHPLSHHTRDSIKWSRPIIKKSYILWTTIS